MSVENLPLMFGLFGVVILISALLSGFIERSNFPQVAVFLGLGFAIGPHGLGLLNVGLESPMLLTVATLSLALVLFTDALTLDMGEVKRHAGLAALILGPGTLVAAAAVSVAAAVILRLPWAMAALLGAPLASTDPVLLRGLLRRPGLPSAARQALRLESGLNDVVLLPIILMAIAIAARAGSSGEVNFGSLLLGMLVIGPGAGVVVGWISIKLLVLLRRKVGVRRDYESLYSLGVALAAFAAAESMHGSGYLAAFAAGITVAALDVELCDCFREYGETTAEMLLLFTFVLLGASLMWVGLASVTTAVVIFAVLALLARPISLLLALSGSKTDRGSKKIIIWYGPRGLSTLLLMLVPVFEGAKGAEGLFHVCTVVVLLSIVVHGGSMMLFGNGSSRKATSTDELIITVEELRKLQEDGEEITLVDVRSERSYTDSSEELVDSVRINPQHARREAEAHGIAKETWAALFCT